MFQLVVPVSLLFCNGIDGELVCCDGYKFIPEQNNCTLCDKGFRGKNCNTKCPYPTYGEECQYICKCNITHCNHVSGCTEASEGFNLFKEQFSKHINYKTVTKDVINEANLDKRNSIKLEVFDISSKGSGLKSQPEVKTETSFLTT